MTADMLLKREQEPDIGPDKAYRGRTSKSKAKSKSKPSQPELSSDSDSDSDVMLIDVDKPEEENAPDSEELSDSEDPVDTPRKAVRPADFEVDYSSDEAQRLLGRQTSGKSNKKGGIFGNLAAVKSKGQSKPSEPAEDEQIVVDDNPGTANEGRYCLREFVSNNESSLSIQSRMPTLLIRPELVLVSSRIYYNVFIAEYGSLIQSLLLLHYDARHCHPLRLKVSISLMLCSLHKDASNSIHMNSIISGCDSAYPARCADLHGYDPR